MSELGEVEVAAREGVPITHVRGEVDLSNVEAIGSVILEAVDPGARGLIVDLTQVDYLDSAGVRLLFQVARDVGRRGGALRAVVPPGAGIRRVLELSDLERQVPIDETVDDALARLDGRAG